MNLVTLKAGDIVVVIDAQAGARIHTLSIGSAQPIRTSADRLPHADGVDVPYVGAVDAQGIWWGDQHHPVPPELRDPADRRCPWQVLHHSSARARLVQTFPGQWPWSGIAEVTYLLSESSLNQVITAHSPDAAMPAGAQMRWTLCDHLQDGPQNTDLTWRLEASNVLGAVVGGDTEPVTKPNAHAEAEVLWSGATWPAVFEWGSELRMTMTSSGTFGSVAKGTDGTIVVAAATSPPRGDAHTLSAVASPDLPHVCSTTWSWDRSQ